MPSGVRPLVCPVGRKTYGYCGRMGAARPFNVRMDPELREAIDRFVQADGVQNASVWAREALAGVVALGGLESLRKALDGEQEMPFEPHPARSLALQVSRGGKTDLSGDCLHPPTARRDLPFGQVCRLCGVRVK